MLLEAVNLGLGGVWIGVYPLEERIEHISNIFDIKGDTLPFAILAIGHPLKSAEITVRYDETRVHYNKWKE
jgi:nitroreductase